MSDEGKSITPNNDNVSKSVGETLREIELNKRALEIQEIQAIDRGLKSSNPFDVIKAMDVVKIRSNDNIDERKSLFLDPNDTNVTGKGYRNPYAQMSYGTLLKMGRVPLVNAVIKTRKNQVAAFAQPQPDQFTQGFVIRKKGFEGFKHELSKADRKIVEEITDFIMKTGQEDSWSRPDFDGFLRRCVEDSLVLDQMNFEPVRTRRGNIWEFINVDSATIRIADSFYDKDYESSQQKHYATKDDYKKIAGYYPSYVQVIQDKPVAVFYPWELCFGTRNSSARIYSYGYGRSELEDLITIVTGILNSDKYNSNFFRVGAAPKGMLRIKGGTNNPRISEFKRQWRSMVSGVENAWRTPVLDAESMEWIDLQKSNRDMEFGQYQQYLIKIMCALYNIDPTEIGFKSQDNMGGGGEGFGSREGRSRLKHSKDKGLTPLLKFIQTNINKFIVSQINPDFYFEFVGIEDEGEETLRARLKDEVQNWKTINEVRHELGIEAMEGGDIILNPTFTAMKQQEMMMKQQEEYSDGGYEGEEGDEGEEGAVSPEEAFFQQKPDETVKAIQKAIDEFEEHLHADS